MHGKKSCIDTKRLVMKVFELVIDSQKSSMDQKPFVFSSKIDLYKKGKVEYKLTEVAYRMALVGYVLLLRSHRFSVSHFSSISCRSHWLTKHRSFYPNFLAIRVRSGDKIFITISNLINTFNRLREHNSLILLGI